MLAEELLTTDNYFKFLGYLDKFDDSCGKYLVENLSDFLFMKFPDETERKQMEYDLVNKFSERLRGFVFENKIDLPREAILSRAEKQFYSGLSET